MKTRMMPYLMCAILLTPLSLIGVAHADDMESMHSTMENSMKSDKGRMEAKKDKPMMESMGKSKDGDMQEPTKSDNGMMEKPMADSDM